MATIALQKRLAVWLPVAIAALVLIVAACGSGGDSAATTSDAPAAGDVGEALPPPGAEPPETAVVEGACLPDEPECEDTVVVEPETRDLPETPDEDGDPNAAGAAASSGMTVNGGLAVSEALAGQTAGVIAVRGHLFDDGSGLRLCESLVGLGERYGCDGAHVSVRGLDPNQVPDVVFLEGTTYTEDEITLLGELSDGVLVVDPLVAG